MSRRKAYIWTGGIGILILMTAADLMCGGEAGAQVLLHLRTPRVLTALLAGAALALAGTQMQSVLRNPLADPHIMGVSAGAALGAALATMLGSHALQGIFHGITIAAAAFAGAVGAAAVILLASRRFRTASSLLIFGVMLGFIVNALVAILQFTSDAESLKMFYSWSAGSFSNSGWNETGIMAVTLVIGFTLAMRNSKGLDIILFGDEFAVLSGARPQRIRTSALMSCCIITGTVTAFCGPIGFVGIVAPHIARTLWKTSAHKSTILGSFLCGSTIGIAADLFSQITSTPIPISSTMALAGIPIILYIMIKGPEYR